MPEDQTDSGDTMKTIAIIDDDIHIGDMLEEILTKEGYSVLRAYSGTEALYLLSNKKMDLVLLDLMLPGLSGAEVLPSSLPFILLIMQLSAFFIYNYYNIPYYTIPFLLSLPLFYALMPIKQIHIPSLQNMFYKAITIE